MTTRNWLQLVLAIGIAVRLLLWYCYAPVTFPDTGTYLAAARDLMAGQMSLAEGRRTPGYPMLMALVGLRAWAMFFLQLLGGLATSVLLFNVTLWVSSRPGFACAVALTYDFNLQQLFLEGALLSESVSTLTVMAVVAVSVVLCHRLRNGQLATGLALLLGTLAGLAIMIRPQFVFLSIFVPLLVGFAVGKPWFRNALALRAAAFVSVPVLGMVMAWSAVVYGYAGYFALSTQTGFSLVNHSVGFIELAPERDATIRNLLIKHRETKLREQGHYGNTGWLALPDIKRATGMTLPQVSRELQRISTSLFAAHPLLYARSIFKSWVDFWTVPIIWQPDQISPYWLVSPLETIWWIEHKGLRLVNALFVMLTVALLLSRRVRAATGWDLDLTNVTAIIMLSSLVQALADYGASSRYAVTIQALVVFVVMTTALRIRERMKRAATREAVSLKSSAN